MSSRRGTGERRAARRPKPWRRVVFCDLDETIYPGATIKDVGAWLLHRGELSRLLYLKILWWLVLHKLGRLDDVAAFQEGVKLLAGWPAATLAERAALAYQQALRPRLPQKIHHYLKEWKKIGPLVLATESLDLVAQPFVHDLGFDDLLATRLEVTGGVVTGRVAGSVLKGETKARLVRDWCHRHQIDLAQSLAVGGRVDDAPLLLLTGRAIMINPDRPAQRLAKEHGWEILQIDK